MGARRCSICAINWPGTITECPACGSAVVFNMAISPNEDWQELLQQANLAAFVRDKDAELIPVVKAKLRKRKKGYTLDAREVVQSGIHRRLKDDEIVRVEEPDGVFTYVEVVGYSYVRRWYHVLPFPTEWPDYLPKEWTPE